MFGTDSLLEGLEQQEERIAETPRSVSSMTSIYLPQIAKDFPEFSLEEFRKKSENSLNAFLSALETQELSSLAGISESLRNQARLRIDDQEPTMHLLRTRFWMRRISVRQMQKQWKKQCMKFLPTVRQV